MKALVGTFNQEKALVGAFSVIVQLHRLIVYSTRFNCRPEQIFALHSALPHCILGTDPAAAAGAWTVKYTSNNNNYNKDIMYIEHIHHALLLIMSSKSLPISNQPKNI